MTRKKVKLVWIVNDTARKASFKKRRAGLLKKVQELTTLCGVKAFIIIYSPDDNEPAVWPPSPEIDQLLARFQSMPEIERCKKMMNQETYLKERMNKVQEHYRKHHRKNRETGVNHLMRQMYFQGKDVSEFDVNELLELKWFAEEKKKEVRKRVEYCEQVPIQAGALPPPAPEGVTEGREEVGRIKNGLDSRPTGTEPFLLDQWFIDMMSNTDHVAGGSSARSDLGLPHGSFRDLLTGGGDIALHHFGDVVGSSNAAGTHANYVLGLPGAVGISMGLGLPTPGDTSGTSGVAAGNLGFPQGNTGGGSGGFGVEPPTTARSDAGMPGVFGSGSGGSDVGHPYDVTKTWPTNFDP